MTAQRQEGVTPNHVLGMLSDGPMSAVGIAQVVALMWGSTDDLDKVLQGLLERGDAVIGDGLKFKLPGEGRTVNDGCD